jgi:hypothetical protein
MFIERRNNLEQGFRVDDIYLALLTRECPPGAQDFYQVKQWEVKGKGYPSGGQRLQHVTLTLQDRALLFSAKAATFPHHPDGFDGAVSMVLYSKGTGRILFHHDNAVPFGNADGTLTINHASGKAVLEICGFLR